MTPDDDAPPGREAMVFVRRMFLSAVAGGLPLDDALAARRMAETAIAALTTTPDPAAAQVAREFDATRRGHRLDSGHATIVAVVLLVDGATWLWGLRAEAAYAEAASTAPSALRGRLAAALGPAHGALVPPVEDLAAMLERSTTRPRRGRLTTAGVVARILMATGACGVKRCTTTISPRATAGLMRRVDNAVRAARAGVEVGRLRAQENFTPFDVWSELRGGAAYTLLTEVKPMNRRLNNATYTELAAETCTDPTSVRRWATGLPVRSTTRQRLDRAADRLGIDRPRESAAPPAVALPAEVRRGY